MLKRRGERVRRVVMWVAGVVLALSVAAWVVSLFRVYVGVGGFGVALWRGMVFVIVDRHTWTNVSSDGFYWPPWWWPRSRYFEFMRFYYQLDWDAYLPLWIPAAGSAGVLLAVGFLRRRTLLENGLCPSCSYDLTGIDGVCPECGADHQTHPLNRRRTGHCRTDVYSI